jgi:hypothetical protein
MVPTLPPSADGAAVWGFIEWAITGTATAVLAVAGFLWRLSSTNSRMRDALLQREKDVRDLREDLDKQTDKQDARHDENQRRLGKIEERLAAQPDKQDLRDFKNDIQNDIERRFTDLKQFIKANGGGH